MTETKNAGELVSMSEAMDMLEIKGRQTLYNLIARENLTVTRKKIGRGRGGQRVFLSRAEIEKLRDAETTAPRATAASTPKTKSARTAARAK